MAENNGRIYKCNARVDLNVAVGMSQTANEGSFVYVGGVAGENPEGAIISDTYYMGKMTVGMGTSENAPTAYYGGICGVNNGITSGCVFVSSDVTEAVGYGAGISS